MEDFVRADDRFNSILVRLKVYVGYPNQPFVDVFQFHSGTIKR